MPRNNSAPGLRRWSWRSKSACLGCRRMRVGWIRSRSSSARCNGTSSPRTIFRVRWRWRSSSKPTLMNSIVTQSRCSGRTRKQNCSRNSARRNQRNSLRNSCGLYLAGVWGERGADHLSLDPSNDNGLVHHRVVLHATTYNGIAFANVTADTMAGPEADATLGERRDRDRIEGLMGVEGIQQAWEQDGLPAMATAHKIDLKGMVTGTTGDGAGVATDGIPAFGQRQPTCDSALPTGDDAVPVLIEIDLHDHRGRGHGPRAPCDCCRVARPSPLYIGFSGPRLEWDRWRPRCMDRLAAAGALLYGRRCVRARGKKPCSMGGGRSVDAGRPSSTLSSRQEPEGAHRLSSGSKATHVEVRGWPQRIAPVHRLLALPVRAFTPCLQAGNPRHPHNGGTKAHSPR